MQLISLQEHLSLTADQTVLSSDVSELCYCTLAAKSKSLNAELTFTSVSEKVKVGERWYMFKRSFPTQNEITPVLNRLNIVHSNN